MFTLHLHYIIVHLTFSLEPTTQAGMCTIPICLLVTASITQTSLETSSDGQMKIAGQNLSSTFVKPTHVTLITTVLKKSIELNKMSSF